MFTGIIETLGEIINIKEEGSNIHYTIQSSISSQLKIDQSVAHNGICLTVIELGTNTHKVTAVDETIHRSNIGSLKIGSIINLERCMLANARFDGHIVQGHVDTTAFCKSIENKNGSQVFGFELKNDTKLIVEKGSICIDGISLTLVEAKSTFFSVAIIPYTFENTSFKNYKIGTEVNIEYDIIGKYVKRMLD